MRKHTQIYLDSMGYDYTEFIPCEVCASKCVDIHHINARGQGGDPLGDKDRIENLMGVCRKCHVDYGDKIQFKVKLLITHLGKMKSRGVKYCSDYFLEQIIKYS